MAETSSLNCLSGGIPYQSPHSLNAFPWHYNYNYILELSWSSLKGIWQLQLHLLSSWSTIRGNGCPPDQSHFPTRRPPKLVLEGAVYTTLRAQRLKKFNLDWKFQPRLKISISIENFNPGAPEFPTKIGVSWVARLKFSISIDNFNPGGRSWIFSIFGPLGYNL